MTATPHNPAPERLLELLADDALFGVRGDDAHELERLAVGHTGTADEMQRVVALLDVAFAADDAEPLPASVRDRVAGAIGPEAHAAGVPPLPVPGAALDEGQPEVAGRIGWVPWMLAAAAIVLAVIAWMPPPSELPAQAELDRWLVAGGPDIRRVSWQAQEDPLVSSGMSGEVIWSDTQDRGYMVFEGLGPNDPTENQYQLWIFDASRSADHPVDGGVFDIPAGGGRVVIPIDPKLDVSRATLFAVTVEQPGGVVVSDRSRIASLATVPEPSAPGESLRTDG